MTSRVAPAEEWPYEEIAGGFRVRHVMTPRDEFVSVSSGERASDAARRLGDDYGYAPVTDEAGLIVGTVARKELEDNPSERVGDRVTPLSLRNMIDADAPLEQLFDWLCDLPFQLVSAQKTIVGLVHAADLNKQPARTLVHLHITDLERRLARLIRIRFPCSREWFAFLTERRRAKIEEVRQSMDQGDVNINLLECVYLDDLHTIITKSDLACYLGNRLRWSLKTGWGGVRKLRDAASHGVRRMLPDVKHMPELRDRFRRVHDLIHAVDPALEELASSAKSASARASPRTGGGAEQ
jgi:hypothetical protein